MFCPKLRYFTKTILFLKEKTIDEQKYLFLFCPKFRIFAQNFEFFAQNVEFFAQNFVFFFCVRYSQLFITFLYQIFHFYYISIFELQYLDFLKKNFQKFNFSPYYFLECHMVWAILLVAIQSDVPYAVYRVWSATTAITGRPLVNNDFDGVRRCMLCHVYWTCNSPDPIHGFFQTTVQRKGMTKFNLKTIAKMENFAKFWLKIRNFGLKFLFQNFQQVQIFFVQKQKFSKKAFFVQNFAQNKFLKSQFFCTKFCSKTKISQQVQNFSQKQKVSKKSFFCTKFCSKAKIFQKINLLSKILLKNKNLKP